MSFLDRFEHELLTGNARITNDPTLTHPSAVPYPDKVPAGRGRGRGRRWRRTTVLGLVVGAAATAGLAAAGVLSVGRPASDRAAGHRQPGAGDGVALRAGTRLLAVRTQDPDGGPAWGMRLTRTTRDLGCLRFGRVVDDRIGVLGRDGAFADDGRLHPLTDSNISDTQCAPLDGSASFIYSLTVGGLPASGQPGSCYDPAHTHGVPTRRMCARRSMRLLQGGLLGPSAKSITYRTSTGAEQTIATVGKEGAYLLVLRSNRFSGAVGGLYPTNGPITRITFKDGTSCQITAGGATPAQPCRVPGYTPAPVSISAAPQIATRVHATLKRHGKAFRLVVRFRARRAITDATASYELQVPTGVGGAGVAEQRNVRAGSYLTRSMTISAARRAVSGRVIYVQTEPDPVSGGRRATSVPVGNFAVRVPG